MAARDLFREILIADLALVLELAQAREVAAALEAYWLEREQAEAGLGTALARIAGLTVDDLRHIEGEVDRLVEDAGGSPRHALLRRRGIDASIHSSFLAGESSVSGDLADLGANVQSTRTAHDETGRVVTAAGALAALQMIDMVADATLWSR